jgi:hypothetical protein
MVFNAIRPAWGHGKTVQSKLTRSGLLGLPAPESSMQTGASCATSSQALSKRLLARQSWHQGRPLASDNLKSGRTDGQCNGACTGSLNSPGDGCLPDWHERTANRTVAPTGGCDKTTAALPRVVSGDSVSASASGPDSGAPMPSSSGLPH